MNRVSFVTAFVISTLLPLVPLIAVAQEAPGQADLVDKVISDLFQRFNATFLCMPDEEGFSSIRTFLKESFRAADANDPAVPKKIAFAVYTAFPCPFSPWHQKLRPAEAADLTGDWLFPEPSQKFRYGPRSPNWQTAPGTQPIKCEAMSYDADGYMRTARVSGPLPCPTSSDMKAFRQMPKVEFWSFIREGRIRTDRSDVPDHTEEWDMFVVEQPFEFAHVQFAKGDLIGYRRRGQDNELNVATMFRHLQRMP